MIDYAKIEVETVEKDAGHIALGALMRGDFHDEIAAKVDCYLHWHTGLDPARWTWRVFTPWRDGMLPSWQPEDVRVVLEARSAVEQLAALT